MQLSCCLHDMGTGNCRFDISFGSTAHVWCSYTSQELSVCWGLQAGLSPSPHLCHVLEGLSVPQQRPSEAPLEDVHWTAFVCCGCPLSCATISRVQEIWKSVSRKKISAWGWTPETWEHGWCWGKMHLQILGWNKNVLLFIWEMRILSNSSACTKCIFT